MQPAPASPTQYRILVIGNVPAIHHGLRKNLGITPPLPTVIDDTVAPLLGEESANSAQPDFQIDSARDSDDGLDKSVLGLTTGRPYAMAFVEVALPLSSEASATITHFLETDPRVTVVLCTAASDNDSPPVIDGFEQSNRIAVLPEPFDALEQLQLAHQIARKWLTDERDAQTRTDLEHLVKERINEFQVSDKLLKTDIAKRGFAEQALRESAEHLTTTFENCPLPIAVLGVHDHKCVEINGAYLTITGYTREEVIGRSPWDVGLRIDAKARLEAMAELAYGRAVRQRECDIAPKAGGPRESLLSLEPLRFGGTRHVIAIVEDVSQPIVAEPSSNLADKLATVAEAGADLENVLAVIENHSRLQQVKSELEIQAVGSLKNAQLAGQRTAALTRQLLCFTRRQVMQRQAVALGSVVTNVAPALRRIIPKNITLTFDHQPGLPLVYADAWNLERVIFNLVRNARDAMPEGGNLSIRTDAVEIGIKQPKQRASAPARQFIRLTVSDTGHGMSSATLDRIFDPLYTTKQAAQGDGMDLATALEIVQQHDGWIEANSTLGEGSTFRVHFPASENLETHEPQAAGKASREKGDTVVLLVDDDDDIRFLAREVLQEAGYRILEAADGHQAITAWREFPGRIDLLLTDMVMPGGLSGNDVAECFKLDRPDGSILFSSGYNTDLFGTGIELSEGVNYLPKPYFARQLLDTVDRVINGGPPSEVGTP
jgi:two-component system, cell cycle sensor histidine kinase and response regulator CckA